MTERQQLQEVFFQEHLDSVYRRRDRVFAWLMLAQWVFGVCIALFYSPYGWEGKVQSTHLHVYYALFVGGALSGSTILLTIFRPGWVVTRHVVAVNQMLWSALLIHLTGGRIETHFHVFGSLAFLAFYRDWKLLISATIVVAGDHLLRGLFWSESVYGITNPEWWRFLEHAFWVVFENVVLVMGILESHREMRALAARQTDLEERVAARTAEVVTAKREVSDILDNMAQAIFTVGEDGTISREFSAHCQMLFTTDRIAGRTPVDLLGLDRDEVSEARARIEGWISTVIGADDFQWRLSASDPPSEIEHAERIIALAYAPIYREGLVHRVMFICRDVTQVRQLAEEVQKKEEENRSMLDRVAQIAALEPQLLTSFLEESNALIEDLRESLARGRSSDSIQRALRALHTLKGNSRAYGLRALECKVHATEDALQRTREERSSPDAWKQIRADVDGVAVLVREADRVGRELIAQRSVVGSPYDRQRIKPIVDAARCLTASFEKAFAEVSVEQRALLAELLSRIIELPLVTFSALVPRLEKVAKDVAAQLGKPAPDLEASLDGLLVEPRVLEKLGGVLTQLVRNAIDHGIEPPLERLDARKEGRGRLSLGATVAGDRLQVQLEDDGRGIDPDRIREVALGRRLISESDSAMHDDKAAIELVFEPGFTTARRVTEISGRGVGLDIVRTSIQELGGEVGIRSGAGRGTAFMVSLPISCARVSRSIS